MPYTSYRYMSDDDLPALYDFIMHEVKPEKHLIRETELGFPFVRPAVLVWDLMFGSSGQAPDMGNTDAQLRRGDYLVNALGHCGECHTTRGVMFQTKSSRDHLAGTVVGGWFAPNITSDKAGIGDWRLAIGDWRLAIGRSNSSRTSCARARPSAPWPGAIGDWPSG